MAGLPSPPAAPGTASRSSPVSATASAPLGVWACNTTQGSAWPWFRMKGRLAPSPSGRAGGCAADARSEVRAASSTTTAKSVHPCLVMGFPCEWSWRTRVFPRRADQGSR